MIEFYEYELNFLNKKQYEYNKYPIGFYFLGKILSSCCCLCY